MRARILSTISLIFILSCTKIKEQDQVLYVRGRIFFNDVVSNNEISLSRKDFKIKLTNDSLKSDYLYSAITDADGYFVLNILPKHLDDTYYISCTGTVNGEEYTSYFRKVTKSKGKDTKKEIFDDVVLNLKLNLKDRTFLYLKTFDTANQPIPNSKIFMYINQAQAVVGNTATASYTYATNPQGELKAKDIIAGTYYTKATAVYTSTVPISSGIYTVTIGTGSVTSETLILQ